MKNKLLTKLKTLSRRSWILIGLTAVALIIVVSYAAGGGGNGPEPIPVAKGDITQEISVTGKTKPIKDVDMAFEKGGRVVRVNVDVGSKVAAGQLLVQLDASDLAAQLAQARANINAQQAKLEELRAGTRPEDLAITQAELQKARQDLDNIYQGVPDVLNDAYTKADDAVRQQADEMFYQGESSSPRLTFESNDSQAQIDAVAGRITARNELNSWRNELDGLDGSDRAAIERALDQGKLHLSAIKTFLNRTLDALVGNSTLAAATVTSYKTNLNTGRTSVNNALSNLNGEIQAVAAQKLVVKRAEDQLRLKEAGSTPQTISAQEAQVASAVAQAQSIQAQIAKMALYAPISGVVTKQEAKIGEIVGPNASLVSIISEGQLSIEANVPEVDIGKVAVGNPVRIGLDAFPGETMAGKVTYIDPGETLVDGVVNFQVTIAFDKADPRLKSGLTANLDIETQKKSGVLLLPQYAILENDQGAFVRVQADEEMTREIPVQIGIRGADGMVEIVSGVKEGEKVLNIGAKTSEN